MITFNNYLTEALDKPVKWTSEITTRGLKVSFIVDKNQYELQLMHEIVDHWIQKDYPSLITGQTVYDLSLALEVGASSQFETMNQKINAFTVYATVIDILKKKAKGKTLKFYGYDMRQEKMYATLVRYLQKTGGITVDTNVENHSSYSERKSTMHYVVRIH